MDNTTNPREEDAKKIVEQPDQIKRIDENWYQVKAQSLRTESWYDVVITEHGFICDCPDNQWRKVDCKHILAVMFSLKLREHAKRQTVIEQVIHDSCPECHSTNFVKHGIRKNKNYDLQRYYCKDCKKWFSFNLGFNGMKANPKAVTAALQLYFTGESLRNVQKFLRLQGVEVSHQTIYNWISKYTNLMERYLEKITPQVSDKWRTDEIYLRVKGNKKFLYAMMDDDTRFWLAKQVSDKKYSEDVRPLFKDAEKQAQKKPMTLISDGAINFSYAFRKEYSSWKTPRPKHIRHIHMRDDRNNNKMERFNGEIRDREKVMRGLKKIDTPIIEGYRIYHNYVRPHMSLNNQTPAEKAGIVIKGNDKWKTLIERATLG